MSDFDEEAERERLREQYERDQRKRKATEKMSDLLLKGATMTNSHCGDCGDPIFRYDGQEFCPTCERIVQGDADDADADADDADADTDAPDGAATDAASPAAGDAANGGDRDDTPEHIEVKRPTGAPAGASDASGSPDESAADVSGPGGESGDSDLESAGGLSGEDAAGVASDVPASDPTPSDASAGASDRAVDRSTPTAQGQGSPSAGETSLSAARESLVRTLVLQARRAEACEDPRQARDHLEAAREAAETLSALSS